MKFKKIFLITLLLLVVLTISSVSAIKENNTIEDTNLETAPDVQNSIEITNDQSSNDVENINDANIYENNILTKSNTDEDELGYSYNSDTILTEDYPQEYYDEAYDDYDDYDDYDIETYIKAPIKKVKYKSNSYFKIKLYDWDYDAVKYKKIILKVWTGKKTKTYQLKTNSKGIAKFNTKKLKAGTHKVKIIFKGSGNYESTYDYSKIIVKKKTTKKITTKKKSSYKTFTLKLKVDSTYYSQKKLKTGDVFLASCNSYARQHPKGIVMGTAGIDAGQEGQHSTKLLKAKVWYKNTQTGKTITKTKYATKNKRDIKKFNWISGYKPIKAKVWYKKA